MNLIQDLFKKQAHLGEKEDADVGTERPFARKEQVGGPEAESSENQRGRGHAGHSENQGGPRH